VRGAHFSSVKNYDLAIPTKNLPHSIREFVHGKRGKGNVVINHENGRYYQNDVLERKNYVEAVNHIYMNEGIDELISST
jgi:hypothetical protein